MRRGKQIRGPFRGKVGTVVGYLWRGKHVVRAYRKEINYPNTEQQQAEREWFVGMVRFAATARQALLLGLRERAAREQMTEGNVFVKMNKSCFGRDAARRVRTGMAPLRPAATSPCEGEERENAISNQRYTTSYQEYATSNQIYTPSGCSPCKGELPEGVRGGIDYERIRIAEGAAAPVRFTTASVDENNVMHVDFERNSGMTRAKASDKVYVYVYNADTREGLLSHPAERRRGQLEMLLPEGWNELNIKVWGFVVDSEGRASGSAYVAVEDAVPEDGDVAESPEGAFNEAGTLGQAIKREPLAGHGADAPPGIPNKKLKGGCWWTFGDLDAGLVRNL